ncbi:galactokinase [Pedobacter psychrotolerans]|uniref:Galactokinase n=1 Tax=Pedobacter psychrotolerans TaxID=1843235 RepID=A0A4R2H6W9_9SPHI|nr:galactokinase [Pedobacter psychrotolerans]TCO21585.1 galactokinase [Pedobacter psychrotolerans]GGE39667.1 galactokinase [Pedobacter psychrotolerans]
MDIERLKSAFRGIYQTEPILVKSPGRINIIGEHTDYNGGFVMPAAINKAIYVAVSKRDDEEIHLYSESYQASYASSITAIEKSDLGWANYVLGVADQLVKRGYKINGFNLYLDGNVPLGAGLSSSAALECATAFALDHLNDLGISQMDLALISQKAEHVFAGVNCGIMDQFASVFGKQDHAVLLDCRTMEYEYIPLELKGYKLVLLNTNVKHSLSDSAYNQRRSQCEQGVAWISAHHPEVTSLRDANINMLEEFVKPKDTEVYQKCKYVVEEIGRIQKAAEALKQGDLVALGKLMLETHEGLSQQYEVSCKELDFLVDYVKDLDHVLGARMMGGGFGGCTINIVKDENIDALILEVSALYEKEFGLSLDAYVVETANGSALIDA